MLAVDPTTGGITTLLAAFDTEQIRHFRKLDDGSLWAASVDPRGSGAGSLVTNRGGTWHTITVTAPVATVAVHLYDVAEVSGVLYVCGSRDILPAEGDPIEDEGAAIVWASNDGGTTWAEVLVNLGDMSSVYNRFYAFGRIGDRLFVSTSHAGGPQGYYVLDGGEWSPLRPGLTFLEYSHQALWGDGFFVAGAPSKVFTYDGTDLTATDLGTGRAVAVDGDRVVYNDGTGATDSDGTDLGDVVTSAAFGTDGALYLCRGEASIYLLPPPD